MPHVSNLATGEHVTDRQVCFLCDEYGFKNNVDKCISAYKRFDGNKFSLTSVVKHSVSGEH